MANRTDPLANAACGTDPQNSMEYITRQRIYDSRFWKEECFGLSAADVLEKAASLQCIGGLPTRFLSLLLKLLQLHPGTELVRGTFLEQTAFKYARALGALYLRLTARPADVFEALQPLYGDFRRLRVWADDAGPPDAWSLLRMDEWAHRLLRDPRALGLALPRLPPRRALEEAGYLPAGPRPSALDEQLRAHGGPLEYFRHKVTVQRSEAARVAWEERNRRLGIVEEPTPDQPDNGERQADQDEKHEKKKRRKESKYDALFKKSKKPESESATSRPMDPATDDAYWDEERAKLGLKPLRK